MTDDEDDGANDEVEAKDDEEGDGLTEEERAAEKQAKEDAEAELKSTLAGFAVKSGDYQIQVSRDMGSGMSWRAVTVVAAQHCGIARDCRPSSSRRGIVEQSRADGGWNPSRGGTGAARGAPFRRWRRRKGGGWTTARSRSCHLVGGWSCSRAGTGPVVRGCVSCRGGRARE